MPLASQPFYIGINDSLALGILNELMGANVPIVVAPYCKAALTSHPAYQASLELLRGAAVTILDGEFSWAAARELLPSGPGSHVR